MGLAVVTVVAGGLPVVESTAGGTPVTEAANGYGVPVTKVTGGKPGLPVVFETIGVAAPVTYATFDATPVNTTVTNGGLTATHNSTAINSGTRSTATKSTGKYYFEMLLQTSFTNQNGAGIILSTVTTYSNTNLTASSTSALFAGAVPTIFSNGVDTVKNLGITLVGDLYGFAIDLTGRLAWVRRNGGNWNADAAANPATGVGGVVIAAAGAFVPWVKFNVSGAAGDAVTANFGASAFVGAVPAGFTSGWPA